MRGINFVQCPTTLLAMVDASVGGKTGVDLPQGKNLIGAFKQPLAVIADLATLPTLSPAEFTSGMAEVVKHGLLVGGDLWQRLETGDWALKTDTEQAVQNLADAIQVKRDVVQADPFEQGIRATLNLGHTFGHAIEQVSQYQLRHGECVAIGLVAAAHLSAQLGHCTAAWQPRIEVVLTRLGLPIRIPAYLDTEEIYAMMFSDKKKEAGKLRFILLRGVIGDINSRRGQIRTQEMRGNATVVRANVPLANMFGYVSQLRSMSQGRAMYTMQFAHYAEVPRNVADEVKAKYA
jgi:3-dehydroquinate synthetase